MFAVSPLTSSMSSAACSDSDRVVTSGHGGVFPPGLPFGQVVSVGEEGVRVQPFVDWGHMEYLRLIDFELPGILSSFQGGEQPGTGR